MPFVLFTALPYVGHLNPLLRQAEELQRRGWRVGVAAASEMAAHVAREAPGIAFVDLGPLGEVLTDLRKVEALATADPGYQRGGFRFLPVMFRIWPLMFDGLSKVLETDRPDLLVIDIFTWWGLDAAQKYGVPFVANNPSLLTGVPIGLMAPAPAVPWMASGQSIHDVSWLQRAAEPLLRAIVLAAVAMMERKLNALRRTRRLPPSRLADALRDRQILVNGAFGLDYERPLPPNVAMVGPMLAGEPPALPADLDAWLSVGPPVVYVNLGTVSFATAEQLTKIRDGVTIAGLRALWVIKPAQAALLPGPLPPGIRLTEWVPSPRAVLAHPNVAVFVSHCGINSAYESLVAGTPIVGIPMLADQRDMAARIADAGAGLWMDKTTFTAAALRRAVERVWREPRFRARLAPIQAACREAGGVARAADLIARAAGQ